MKKVIFFARLHAWLIFAAPLAALAQDTTNYPKYYVVIGAFASEHNAVRFAEDARHQYAARFEINPNRNLYYVYVLTTAEREIAVMEAVRLRTDTKYFDTWVYSGALGDRHQTISGRMWDEDINPLTGEQFPLVIADRRESPSAQQPVHSVSENVRSTELTEGHNAAARQTQDTTSQSSAQVLAPKRVSNDPLQPQDVAGKNFYFHLFRADNGIRVEGEVDAIDFERSRKMATYPANTLVTVHTASGIPKHISFLCQVFGYRKLQKEFDPEHPSEDLYLDDTGSLVVPFELMRLQKGDIAIMYNVLFFKDAAVMRPESRYEVNNLLELMKENPSYSIRIHGHTNGNSGGKIIRMNTPGNFYSLSGTKQGYGSAKKLSEERAMLIRDYLISSGIAEDRMDVKAWGGKKPIHDPTSVRASENVRVEIEILSGK